MNNERICVLGKGVVSCLGSNYFQHKKNLFENFDYNFIIEERFKNNSHEMTSFVGKVDKLAITVPDIFINHSSSFKYAFSAFTEALEDSGLDIKKIKKIGVCFGTSLGGKLFAQELMYSNIKKKVEIDQEFEKIRRKEMHNIIDEIMEFYEIEAETYTISTACSASSNAVILGKQMLETGECNLVFCGGSDEIADISLGGFTSLGAINKNAGCSPYYDGSGISLGEGAGFIVLGRESDYIEQKNYAVIGGGAITSDAYHITAPEKNGVGAEKCIKKVLMESSIDTNRIDYINGHGTGTKANDLMEKKLYERLFPEKTLISSTKGLTGHTLGAAGIIEIINCIATIEEQCVPPTKSNSENGMDLYQYRENFIRDTSINKKIRYVLNLSFAFGGNDSCVLLIHPEENINNNFRELPNIDICSMSILDQFRNIDEYSQKHDIHVKKYQEIENPGINPKEFRKLDNFSKAVVSVVDKALSQAPEINIKNSKNIGAVFCTASGPIQTTEEIETQIYEKGYESVSASKFPYSVLNAAVGSLSIIYKIRGPISVISDSHTGIFKALKYSQYLLLDEDLDYVLVVLANQVSDTYLYKYDLPEIVNIKHVSESYTCWIVKRSTNISSGIQISKIEHTSKKSQNELNYDLINKCYDSVKERWEDIPFNFYTDGTGEDLINLLSKKSGGEKMFKAYSKNTEASMSVDIYE